MLEPLRLICNKTFIQALLTQLRCLYKDFDASVLAAQQDITQD